MEIFKTFLSDRYQYVSIDGRESDIDKLLEYSVIQGSKLSSLLYILYTNKIPFLHEVICSESYGKLTGDKCGNDFSSISNYIIQYVDDSSNLISSNNIDQLDKYIDKYFKILENFYNLNKLTLNSDKTKFMVTCKPNIRCNTINRKLNTTQYVIEQ